MKRLFLTTFLLITVSSFGQNFSFGPKAGLNISGSDAFYGSLSSNRTSLHAGIVANVRVYRIIALQGEAVYSPQGYTLSSDRNGSGRNIVDKWDYINFPLMVDIHLVEGLSAQGGAQMGVLVNEVRKDEDTGETIDHGGGELAGPIDWSLGFGLQYRFPLGLMFQTRYTYGFTSASAQRGGYWTNRNFNISVGWFFPNKNKKVAK